MAADRETVLIDLEAVPQARLHDPFAALDLADQPMDVGNEIVVDAAQVCGDDRSEQQSAEPGRGVDRQHHVPERDSSGRHRRAGVPDLEFGEQHRRSWPSDVGTDERTKVLGEPDHLRLVDRRRSMSWACAAIRPVIASTPSNGAGPGPRRQPVRRMLDVDLLSEIDQGRAGSRRRADPWRACRPRRTSCRAPQSGGSIPSPVAEQFARLDRVEQIVDVVFGIGGNDQRRAFQRCGISASISASLNVVRSAVAPLVEHEVGRPARRRRARSGTGRSSSSKRSNSASISASNCLGDDDLVAVPRMRQLGGRKRLGEFGPLVEVPRREVVVDLDDGRIVGIEVERFTEPARSLRCSSPPLFTNATAARYRHHEGARSRAVSSCREISAGSVRHARYSSRWLIGSRKPWPSPS